MKGYKTYTGLVITLLGLIGVSKWFSASETAQVADIILQAVGLLLALYGRMQANKK